MTRKDFEEIAEAIRLHSHVVGRSEDFDNGAFYAGRTIARELVRVLQRSNPRFDVSKFLDACGIDDLR